MDKRAVIATLFAAITCAPCARGADSKSSYVALPQGQESVRRELLFGRIESIVHAAELALRTYDAKAPSGWTRHVIQRPARLFGSTETVILSKVDSKEKVIELAIRGTASLDDALVDLNTKAVIASEMGVPVHSGFYSIARDVIDLARQLQPPNTPREYKYKLYGHSLGGAVAAIVAMVLHQMEYGVAELVTFGAPRYTTNQGARRYLLLNQRTLRVVRCDDVVPFMPPPNFFGWSNNGYEASGDLLLLLKPPSFDYAERMDIERDFVRQLRTELENAKSREKLAYGHRMSSYVKYFETLLDEVARQSRKHGASKPPPGGWMRDIPTSYSLDRQKELCPAKLGETRPSN